MKLEDFIETEEPSIEELSAGFELGSPVVSKASNLNLATYAAALSGDPQGAVDTYRTVNAELETGSSPTLEDIKAQAKTRAVQGATQQLPNILLSTEYSDEEKRAAAIAALDAESSKYDVNNLLSAEALVDPVKNEDYQMEATRIDMAPYIEEVNELKRYQQALFNQEMAKEDPSTAEKVLSFAEFLVPFADQANAANIIGAMREAAGGEAGSSVDAFTLLGEYKEQLPAILASVPPEQRLELTQKVVDIVNNMSSIALVNGNDFRRKEYLELVLQQGTYDDAERWLDNVVGILDMTIIGGPVAKALKGSSAGAKVTKATGEAIVNTADALKRRMVKTRVQPATTAQNYKDVNPEKAKAAYEASVVDASGEAAQAFYGTTKEEVVASEVAPEILDVNGAVINKVGEMETGPKPAFNGDANLIEMVETSGQIYFTQAEKAEMRAAAVERFKNVVGMEARTEMFQYGTKGNGVHIRAVYGPSQGGFSDPEVAMEMAKFALRKEGIDDSQIKLLVRDGSNYRVAKEGEFGATVARKRIELQGQEPSLVTHGDTTLTDIGSTVTVRRKPKDFLVMVEHDYTFRPTDIVKWSESDVKYNIWDRYVGTKYSALAGKVWANILDRASTFGREISGAASVQIDKAAGTEKLLLDLAKPITESLSKSDKEVQAIFNKLVNEANEKGIEHSVAEMRAAGLRDAEIQAMKDWRKYWDTMYELENRDLAKTLRNRGYMEYVDTAGDTRLFAKPIGRNQTGKVGKVYDPTTGEVKRLTDSEVKALYESGGQFARMRQPMVIADEAVEDIIVRNVPGQDYLKAITDNSRVLNYRKGYYTVHYKEPYFVVEKVKNKRGEVLYERAIANLGSKIEAELFAKSRAAVAGKVYEEDYFVRGDIKAGVSSSNEYWDVQQVQGRTAQRVRGKRLEEADTNAPTPELSNILDPSESLIKAARSISYRTSMRDMLDTMRMRFVNQYEEYLPMGDFGQKVMPNNIEDILYRGGGKENPKKLADAYTTFEYIKYLEDGYINAIDEVTKATLKSISDIAGNAGWDKTDKALKWMSEGRGPAAMMKNFAFQAYLATNPLRQFVVQSHQAMQLMALYPKYLMSGTFVPQTTVMMMRQAGIQNIPDFWLKGCGWTRADLEKNFKVFQRSGQVAAIDKQNLVRGSLTDLADSMSMSSTTGGKVWRAATAPLHFSRKIGFDTGEYINTLTSWLAHRDAAIRQGKNFDNLTVQDEVAAASRNFTYNMNAAGDMKYNQSTLSVIFQFMQVPHKALLTMTFNRQLSTSQKLRLFGFNATMYTLPPAAMYSWFGADGLDILPDSGEAREAVVQGLEGYTLNKLLSMATGEKTSIDFSSLSPFDVHGLYEFIHSLLTTDSGTILASNPSGQLLFGGNPRLTNFVMSALRYTNLVDDYQDPTTLGQVALEFAKISSGLSNGLKAAYALEYERKFNTFEGNSSSNVTSPEALAMALGFGTLDEARKRYVQDKMYNVQKDVDADVKQWYKGLKQHLQTKYGSNNEYEFMSRVYSEAWRVWGNDNVAAKRIIDTQLKKDFANGDDYIISKIVQSNGMLSKEQMLELGRNAKFRDEAQRERFLQAVENIDAMKNIGE